MRDDAVLRRALPLGRGLGRLLMPKLHLADLSKTRLRHVRWWQVQTRICPYLACLRHVLDKSARWSLGINELEVFDSHMTTSD